MGEVTNDDVVKVRDQVRNCKRCELGFIPPAPVAFTTPRLGTPDTPLAVAPGNGITVVGDFPIITDAARSSPFSSGPATYLRRMLTTRNIDVSQTTFVNVVSCCMGGTLTSPKDHHIDKCQGNLHDQIRVAGSRWLLICGAGALRGFYPKLKLGEVRGKWVKMRGVEGGPWGLVTFHPQSVFRDRNLMREWEGDLDNFAFHQLGVFDPDVGQMCVEEKCRELAEEWNSGWGVCRKHRVKVIGRKGRKRKGRKEMVEMEGQESLW